MDIIRTLDDFISVLPPFVLAEEAFNITSGDNDYQCDTYYNSISRTGTQNRAGQSSSTSKWDSGFVFSNVTIPQGAKIVSAKISLCSVNAFADKTISLKIVGNDVDDASYPANWTAYSGFALTDAVVEWDPTSQPANFVFFDSPDITGIVQEIVDRPGWISGNDMQIIVKNDESPSNNYLLFYGYEQGSAYAPVLNVVFDYIP